MARISLVEQYDNKDVIQQIYMLKTATDGWEERISASEQASNEAYGLASGLDGRMDSLEASQSEVRQTVAQYDARIETVQQTADNAVGRVDDLDRQVTSRIADQEVTALDVASAGTGAYAVTAHKQNGNITSNSFNISKVTSATIGEGSAQNSIYLQLNLSDGTTVRTNDTVISITGVEEDIHVTSIVLEDAPDAHTIKAIFTYNNGQSISSNTLTYDYPDVASSSSPGLVMGNDSVGGVQVDGQGRMSVVGWDTFATQDALEALEDEVGAVGQAGTIRNDIHLLDERVTQNSTTIDQLGTGLSGVQEQSIESDRLLRESINALESAVGAVGQAGTIRNDISLLQTKDTELQQAVDGLDARCDNLSSTVSDHGTMLSAQAEAIQENTTAIAGKQDKLTLDTEISASSENPVQNKVISAALDTKASTATTDALTQELTTKQDNLTFDSTPTLGSPNPVTSGGVYDFVNQRSDYIRSASGAGVKGSTQDYPDTTPPYRFDGNLGQAVFSDTEGFATIMVNLPDASKDGGSVAPDRFTLGIQADGTWTVFAYYPEGAVLFDRDGVREVILNLFAQMKPLEGGDDTTGALVVATHERVYPKHYGVTSVNSDTGGLYVEMYPQMTLTAGTGISIVDGVISVNLSNANGVSF